RCCRVSAFSVCLSSTGPVDLVATGVAAVVADGAAEEWPRCYPASRYCCPGHSRWHYLHHALYWHYPHPAYR
ncbi:hypothetical protein MJN59_25315, partial [Salmonella enterica subsp. enterica serovar Anatum]|nr:hypothetical protein [Salmonella enterica subsp. enterica serovar Anatum]